MERIRIFIVEPLTIYRTGICLYLSAEDDFQIVGNSSSIEFAIPYLETKLPDVLFFRFDTDEFDGMSTLQRLKQNFPALSIILFTLKNDEHMQFMTLKYGADDIISLDIDRKRLVDAVRAVALKKYTIANLILKPDIAARIREEFASFADINNLNEFMVQLTPLEERIITHLSSGFSVDLIRRGLNLSSDIVKRYLDQIRQKLIYNCQILDLLEKVQDSSIRIPKREKSIVRYN